MNQKTNPKIAIAVQKYFHPGQTFVNRHIRHLFGGNSCVIAERHQDEPDAANSRPVFYVGRAARNAQDLIRLPYAMAYNRKHFDSYRVPYGNNRKAMIKFLHDQKADLILSEFGSQSMLVADVGREIGLPVFCYFRGRDASLWVRNYTIVK